MARSSRHDRKLLFTASHASAIVLAALSHGTNEDSSSTLHAVGLGRRGLRHPRTQKPKRELERSLFVLSHMVEALAHGAAYGRPPRVSAAAAKEEAVHAVLAYLRS